MFTYSHQAIVEKDELALLNRTLDATQDIILIYFPIKYTKFKPIKQNITSYFQKETTGIFVPSYTADQNHELKILTGYRSVDIYILLALGSAFTELQKDILNKKITVSSMFGTRVQYTLCILADSFPSPIDFSGRLNSMFHDVISNRIN